jgi:hypothetical protein
MGIENTQRRRNMSESKNNKNENSPFTQKPFSSDVWEQAYKNVGRPFEKKAFDNVAKKDTQDEAPASDRLTSLTPEERRKLIEEKKARLDKAEVSAPKKSSQPQSKTNNNADSSETYYSRFKDYHGDEESESEDVFDMIKNVFTGIFGEIPSKIKEALDLEDVDDKKINNIIWGAIAVIIFIILGLAGAL